MIITLAGRRIDAPGAATTRFPLANSGLVGQRIRQLLSERRATALVSSAACGADLLALEAAGQLGIRRRVILSFAPDRFRQTSVADRPGDWEGLYDRIIAEVQAAGDLVLLNEAKDDEAAFLRANGAILDEAQQLAREAGTPGDNLLAVLVWEGQPRGADDITAAFRTEARARAIPTIEILTR